MRRRFSGGLSQGGGSFSRESANPLEGMANLVDVMLVIAVGLMLALVINWNVDIAARSDENAARGREIAEIEGLSGEGAPLDGSAQYEELDVVVYRDPATDRLYMVERGEE
ncbi:MAG: DUF2149 domain-containing protein [Clostridiales Family XIII bacterium]|jgi:hypothetical protein|nr:DUF2149 domain-containing protein [Clostridiales Family XIII bacterium]